MSVVPDNQLDGRDAAANRKVLEVPVQTMEGKSLTFLLGGAGSGKTYLRCGTLEKVRGENGKELPVLSDQHVVAYVSAVMTRSEAQAGTLANDNIRWRVGEPIPILRGLDGKKLHDRIVPVEYGAAPVAGFYRFRGTREGYRLGLEEGFKRYNHILIEGEFQDSPQVISEMMYRGLKVYGAHLVVADEKRLENLRARADREVLNNDETLREPKTNAPEDWLKKNVPDGAQLRQIGVQVQKIYDVRGLVHILSKAVRGEDLQE